MKVRLTKLSQNTNDLRTNVIEGELYGLLPTKGQQFIMTAPGLVEGTRIVSTSPIVEVEEKENHFEFKTENSLYKLELLDLN